MPPPAVLLVIGGADRGKSFELTRGDSRIGRGTDQDVVLADIAVSRRHVTIHLENDRYRLQDLGSGNGTLVNGRRVDSVVLNDGDQIELGNTMIRFEHAASRPSAGLPPLQSGLGAPSSAPQGAPPAAYAAPPPAYPAPAAPPGPAPSFLPPVDLPAAGPVGGGYPQEGPFPGGRIEGTPSATVDKPPRNPRGAPAQGRGAAATPLDTPLKQVLVFGAMVAVILFGLVVIVSRTVMAKAPLAVNQAEEAYRKGLRLFSAGDYEGARAKFADALSGAPGSPEATRYVQLCQTELVARSALKKAERALASGRYLEAVRALDEVDASSLLHDHAARLRKEQAPRAAAEVLDEARRLSRDDVEGARKRLDQVLELDPTNSDARELREQLSAAPEPSPGGDPPPPSREAATSKDPTPPEKKSAPAPTRTSKRSPRPASVVPDRDGELAPVKVSKARPSKGEGGAALGSKAALAAYKSRDFAAAEKALRLESTSQPTLESDRSVETANQIHKLRQAYERASATASKDPVQAVRDYEEAIALDAKLGHGMHAAFFRVKMAKTQLAAAQAAFQRGKYDYAYQAVLAATKAGTSDGGLLRQLEAKAAELVAKGEGARKSNLAQAKTYWRTVLKMVPATSPSYAKAYSLLNNSSSGRKDEDED